MVDPSSDPQEAWESGTAEGVSQVSFSSGKLAADRSNKEKPTARLLQLRNYVKQMQGMLLDTQA